MDYASPVHVRVSLTRDQYAAPPDVAIAPDILTAEQSLPSPATGGLCRMLDAVDADSGEHPFYERGLIRQEIL
jgi:hypothetical protein